MPTAEARADPANSRLIRMGRSLPSRYVRRPGRGTKPVSALNSGQFAAFIQQRIRHGYKNGPARPHSRAARRSATARLLTVLVLRTKSARWCDELALRCSERVDLLDADEHAVASVVVREPGALSGGVDRPALRVVGLVVDGDGRDCPEVAQDPLHGAVGVDVDAVGVLAILHRGAGERGFTPDAVRVDLAARQTGLRLDENVTVLVGLQRDGAGRPGRACRCRRWGRGRGRHRRGGLPRRGEGGFGWSRAGHGDRFAVDEGAAAGNQRTTRQQQRP